MKEVNGVHDYYIYIVGGDFNIIYFYVFQGSVAYIYTNGRLKK